MLIITTLWRVLGKLLLKIIKLDVTCVTKIIIIKLHNSHTQNDVINYVIFFIKMNIDNSYQIIIPHQYIQRIKIN